MNDAETMDAEAAAAGRSQRNNSHPLDRPRRTVRGQMASVTVQQRVSEERGDEGQGGDWEANKNRGKFFKSYEKYEEDPSKKYNPNNTKDMDKRCIILDVGGDRFIVQRSYIEKYPSTRLGKLVKSKNVNAILKYCDEYVPGDPPEYFFDRNPTNFGCILDMYRTRQGLQGLYYVLQILTFLKNSGKRETCIK